MLITSLDAIVFYLNNECMDLTKTKTDAMRRGVGGWHKDALGMGHRTFTLSPACTTSVICVG